MSAITTWYKNLNEREKPMIQILALLLAIFVLYFAIVSPVNGYMQQLEEDKVYFEDSLATVSMQAKTLASNKGSRRTTTKQTLNQLLNQSAKRYSLSLKNISETKRNKELQLRLDDAEFDQLLRWVVTLENQHGLTVDTLRVSDTDVVGRVDVSLKITRI